MKTLDRSKAYYLGCLNDEQIKKFCEEVNKDERSASVFSNYNIGLLRKDAELCRVVFDIYWVYAELLDLTEKQEMVNALELFEEESKKETKIKAFTESDLVSFGNYLLSGERKKRTSVKNRGHVTHSDMENWKINKESK